MLGLKANSLIALWRTFPNEAACIKHLEKLYWNDCPVSPFEAASKVYRLKNGQYRCKNTGKNFNVKTGTLFENTKIGLVKWFTAIWLVANNKKGISSYQLARDIEVTQKTAWFMLTKIRSMMECENEGLLHGEVEIDETYVGGKNKNRHIDKKVPHSQGRSHKDKTTVVGMVERGGKLIAKVTADVRANTLSGLIRQYVHPQTAIYTDEHDAYNQIGHTYRRRYIDHSKYQYADGDVTTNRIENCWTHLKRMVHGTYHRPTRRYLQRYVNEFVFRYNLRGKSDGERFNLLLCIWKLRKECNLLEMSVG